MAANLVREHPIQTVFVLLQTLVLVLGSTLVAVSIKIYCVSGNLPVPGFSALVRDWGFLLLLVSGTWAFWTVALERNPANGFTKRWSLVSGILLLVSLYWLLQQAVVSPPLIQVVPLDG